MYQRILVPVDGSAYSAEVVPRAVALAAHNATPLVLLRIVGSASGQAAATRETDQLAARASAQGVCIHDGGDVADGILREAARVPDTLIVMTSHGRSGLLEAILGSVALRLVRAGRGPILVYRPTGHDAAAAAPPRVSRVVVPMDGTAPSEAIAADAARLAAWLGARLVVVSVMDASVVAVANASAGDLAESSYVRARAQELARPHGIEPGWEVLHGRAATAIVDFVQEDPGTLLAMSTRGRTALRSALLGSVTSACLRDAGVPVFMRVP